MDKPAESTDALASMSDACVRSCIDCSDMSSWILDVNNNVTQTNEKSRTRMTLLSSDSVFPALIYLRAKRHDKLPGRV